jgi:anti-sigma B factor antagonist
MPENSGALIVQRIGDVHLVEFVDTNILDQVLIERIKEELLDLVERCGLPKIVLSFDNVKHVSSAMLGAIMTLNKRIAAAKGELRLSGIHPQLMEVFRLTRLDKILKIYKTSDEALVKFVSQ